MTYRSYRCHSSADEAVAPRLRPLESCLAFDTNRAYAPVKRAYQTEVAKAGGCRIWAYPPAAYEFVQGGLSYTVEKVHRAAEAANASRHVTGQQLCEGLREYALGQWGLMARTVLRRWLINSTLDFGRIVFALIEAGHMQKTPDDCIEDFRDIYDFGAAFESGYRIQLVS